MAGYMMLIWDDEAAWAAASEQDVEQAMQAHRDFGARYAQAICGAADFDAAVAIAQGCPVLQQGGSLEVGEIVPA